MLIDLYFNIYMQIIIIIIALHSNPNPNPARECISNIIYGIVALVAKTHHPAEPERGQQYNWIGISISRS